MPVTETIRRHKLRAAVGAAVVIAAVGFAAYWFGPWHLFVDRRVEESLPGLDTAAAATPQPDEAGRDGGEGAGRDEPDEPTGPVILAQGSFRSIEHESSGDAFLIELPDGDHIVRFEDLDVLSGPDLRVYLAEASKDAPDDAFGRDFVDLGGLKGNQGNQNYTVPRSVDVEDFSSVAVWCRRFSVGFGVADLTPVSS